MERIIDFLKDFLLVFWNGIVMIFMGIFGGLYQLFNFPEYAQAFKTYSGNFNAVHWLIAILAVILIVAMLVALVWVVVYFLIRFLKSRKNVVMPDDLVDEISSLKRQIVKLSIEKERILGMKLSNFGADFDTPISIDGEGANITVSGDAEDDGVAGKIKEGESRFYKLTEVDAYYETYEAPEFDYNITLEELCDRFRNFACNKMKLFYEKRVIRLFFAGLATTRLIILQGISGTGKTSLPYSIGQFLHNPATIASVQPSWRDRTELFGYFNEFTKRFNETQVLKKMYEATFNDMIYLTVLDEMNIARVEYYFAEMLSILEMPSRAEWIVDLVPSGWPSDPKHVEKGRFRLPENMWFVGTANNDDSTFAVSDKVYDRSIPISIDTKGVPFDAPETDKLHISYKHLENMFKECQEKYKVSDEIIDQINKLDDYVIEHFRLAFGNRIVKQLREFVPAYVGCGGTEIDGIDYVLANKILRKFESLNLSYIRDEIDGLIGYLSDVFGEENMQESKAYLTRLKKLF